MPRPPRLLLSHSYYHIMTRGNNKNKIFREEGDYFYYLNLIERFKVDLPFELYHYCLMPTHVHMLIKTKDAHNFSTYMKKINLAYFHYYRRRYGWIGHFWQDRFKSQPVGKDEYFIQCGKYIELNPVRKGLAIDLSDYLFSSYGFYVLGRSDLLVTPDMFYEQLGASQVSRQQAYQDLAVKDLVLSGYNKNIWAVEKEKYNEMRKIKYNLK